MNTKKKHGPGSEYSRKKSDAEELGKAIKRKVINRVTEEESLEEIKEYVYNDKQYVDNLIKTHIITIYD